MNAFRDRAMKRQRGFSIIELVVVMSILGITAALAVPRAINSANDARLGEADLQLQQIRAAQLRYFQDQGTYATSPTMLSIEWPIGGMYTYAITGANGTDFTVVATRDGQPSLAIQRSGSVYKPYYEG